MAARRLGEDEAYLTVRDILSEASTVADGALSRERSGFYRCRFASLGFDTVLFSIHFLLRSVIMSVSLNHSDSGLTIQDLY
ncbi:MAG: hypothetical protein WBH36_06475, partial [Syntrophobacteria bacterium]